MNCAILGAGLGVIAILGIWVGQSRLRSPMLRASGEPYVKNIHQIWFQGAKNVPERFEPMRAGCSDINSDWNMLLHDEQALRSFCENVDRVDPSINMVDLFDSAEHMHEKIDMGRLAALYKHGGVSLDMDIHCLNEIDNIVATVPRDGLGLCSAPRGPLMSLFHHGQNVASLNNAVWVVPQAESPVLLDVIGTMAAGARANYAEKPSASKYHRIESTWGPRATSIAIAKHGDKNIVMLEGLEEPSFSGEKSSCKASSALCHVHEGSWLDNRLLVSRPASALIERYTKRPFAAELVLAAGLGAAVMMLLCRIGCRRSKQEK
tara:strand:- start:585 stop:1544 length:960 start_codon:yes stop_codon:yes gene_type:complete